MNKSLVQERIFNFVQSYDSTAKDKIWQKQSADFRRFWSERVLALGKELISDDDCDAIIRILDSNGTGNTKDSESVAKVRTTQHAWRKLFNILHSDKKLASLVDSIFKEADIDRKAQLIDELYSANVGKNRLTGKNGNVLNALLVAYDPVKNLSAVSMKHRIALMDFLEIKSPFDWDSASIGKRISYSNESIQRATRALGLVGSARTLYQFLYFEPIMNLWHAEDIEFKPTADEKKLEEKTKKLLTKSSIEKPLGQEFPKKVETKSQSFERDPKVRAYVLRAAKGKCELCNNPAPFETTDDTPFLEVHHVKFLADYGSDRIQNAVAVCPNCHRSLHQANDSEKRREKLYRNVKRLKRE